MQTDRTSKMIKTVAYYVAFIALGLTSALLGPTLLGLAENTGSALALMSYSIMARSLGYLIGSSLGGRVYDRLRGHPVQGAALVTMALTFFLTPLAMRLWLLILIWLITGTAEGMLDVGTNTLLVWVHQDKVGPFMNGLHFFFGLGSFLAPLLTAQVMLRADSVRWVYWVSALLIMPVSLLFFRLPSPEIQGENRENQDNLKINKIAIVLIALFFFLIVGVEISVGDWIYTYAVAMGVADKTTAAYLNSAFWGAFTLGRLLAIPLAIKLRLRTMLFGDLLLALICIVALHIWSGISPVVWMATTGAGLAIAPLFATTMSLAERLMPISGRVTGYFFVGVSSGSLVMPWLIGQLIEPIGPTAMTMTILVDVLLAWVILIALIGGWGDGRRAKV